MVNRLKNLFRGFWKYKYRDYFLLFFCSLSSLWLLIFYFFSWEEFSFFYAYQNLDYYDTVFNSHGFSNHPLLRYLSILFKFFGYNPIPYNILSLLTFFLLNLSVYFFVKEVFNFKNRDSLFTGLLSAAGYFGVGTYTTDTFSGFVGGFGIIFELLTIIFFDKLIKKISIKYLIFFIISYLISVAYFIDRNYFLFGLLIILMIFRESKMLKFFVLSIFIISPLFLFVGNHAWNLTTVIPHINIRIYDYLSSLFGNVGYVFIPSLIFPNQNLIVILGVIISMISVVNKETRLLFLFLAFSIGAQLIAILINSQYFAIWLSDNHFQSSFIIFSIPIIVILLRRKPAIISVIILFTIFLSNIEVYHQLITHSNGLRYFYETIQKQVPKRDRKAVILIYSKIPKPIDPFIHLPEISGEVYLAGFYNKNVNDLYTTQDFKDTLSYLRKNNLTSENVFVFTYAAYNLHNVTQDFRRILNNDKTLFLDSSHQEELVGLVPMEVKFSNPKSLIKRNLLVSGNSKLDDFYNWHEKILITTIPEQPYGDRKKEYLLDNDFETTWIPNHWESPVSIILKLPEKKLITKVVWSVSRTNSWPFRTPTDYKFLVSEDGNVWNEVTKVKNGEKLLTNQYRLESFDYPRPVGYVRFEVYKTLEGYFPAVDEMQVIPSDIASIDYNIINNFIEGKLQKICLQWKTNDDIEFRASRQICQTSDNQEKVINIEPRIEKVTGFRVVDKNNKPLEVKQFRVKYLF